MMRSLALEDFATSDPDTAAASRADWVDPDIVRKEGYEKGYSAGWDDALQAAETDRAHIDAELGRNLEELSFTFAEAQAQVCMSLESLARAMADVVLPALYSEHFGSIIAEKLAPLISDTANLSIDLICAPSAEDQIRTFLATQTHLPLSIRTEASFARHQVRFQLGHEVHDVDGDALLAEIRSCLDHHFSQLQETHAHAS